MKKYQVLSLVVSSAMIFSIVGFGCKKAEQPAEAPKQAEQAQSSAAPAAVEGFEVSGGTLEKKGLGFVLTSEKGKHGIALKKLDKPYTKIIKVACKLKSSYSGPRNGYIVIGENDKTLIKAGVLIGRKSFVIEGPLVKKIEVPQQFVQSKVFDVELVLNLEKKTVALKVDGQTITTEVTKIPASINYIGYSAWDSQTEFSDLQISE